MSVNFEIEARLRTDMGKGASRRLRRTGEIPAVMYGGGQDPASLTLSHDAIMHALENEAFYSHILSVNVEGKKNKAVLRDVQRHPSKPTILHIDLQRVSEGDRIHMLVPIHVVGEEDAPGVAAGGLVNHNMSEVEINCQAKNLPEYLEVDISNLEAGHAVHLSDVKLPEGVEIIALSHGADHDLPVVSIHMPRGASTEEAEEGEAGE